MPKDDSTLIAKKWAQTNGNWQKLFDSEEIKALGYEDIKIRQHIAYLKTKTKKTPTRGKPFSCCV